MSRMHVFVLLTLTACGSDLPAHEVESRPITTGAPFELGDEGCPMAHCDPAMSDYDPIAAPVRRPRVVASDGDVHGAGVGLGCSSNGSTAVCSFGSRVGSSTGPYVVAYDSSGDRRWTSGDWLGSTAFASAPMVDVHGGAIAADAHAIIRFDEHGDPVWTNRVAGLPISPVPVDGGAVLIATQAVIGTSFAPVLAYDSGTGELLGCLHLGVDEDVAGEGDACFEPTSLPGGAFATVNTPGGRGGRVYVAAQLVAADGTSGPHPHGRLYAIDVDPAAAPGQRLSRAWAFDFVGPSGASPLVIGDVVFFDGAGVAPGQDGPFFFAVRDRGDRGELVWRYQLPRPAQASAAQDPRGGLWVFGAGDSQLIRLAEEPDAAGNAVELQRIDVADLVRGGQPSSVMSITGPSDDPTLLVSSRSLLRSELLAIRLTDGTLRWRVDTGAMSFGQYPVMRDDSGAPVVAVATTRDGVRFLR